MMRMGKYRHIQEFTLGFCDVDFKDEIKPSTVLAYLEEVACLSADELGFGYRFLKPKGYAFMVTEIRVKLHKKATLGERIKMSTWPTPPTFVVFGREYEGYDQAGEKVLSASSKWCMIDFATGKILSSKLLVDQDYSTYCTDKAIQTSSKIAKFPMEEGEKRFEICISNSEYDHNMHVNNTKYIDYCFNCFSVQELSTLSVEEFAIAYVKQCYEGEKLSFYRKKDGEKYLICGFNQTGALVVRAEVTFAKG